MSRLTFIALMMASVWMTIALTSCQQVTVPVTAPPVSIEIPRESFGSDCSVISETLVLKNQTAKLPKMGKFVLESHLATKSDTFPAGRLFPQSVSEGILDHMNRSCEYLKKLGVKNCLDVFSTKYHRAWTPPESGKAGQGSVGNLKPTVEEEMWSGNLYWTSANKPKPGTKFLASRGGRHVVVVMGYETGPRDPSFLGGLQGEVMWWLQANNSHTDIQLGRLKDQTLPPGPVICK